MTKRKYEFDESITLKTLLWCERHCCLCGKQAGVSIEVAHLNPKRSDLDNAMPLCFDCHAETGHYNPKHPRGRKYRIEELKARRDQIYELHTRHLVPPVTYSIQQAGRTLPDVGFHIGNLGDTYSIRARIQLSLAQGTSRVVFRTGHYNGAVVWNLNPGFGVGGHFGVPKKLSGLLPVRARVDVTLIDIYDREHILLPVGWVNNMGATDEWYLEASEEKFAIPKPRKSRKPKTKP